MKSIRVRIRCLNRIVLIAFLLSGPFFGAMAQRAGSAAAKRPTPAKKAASKPAVNKNNNATAGRNTSSSRSNSGSRDVSKGNKNNIGNNVNIDNSHNNVNINVDNSKDIRVNNSRNTMVRHNVGRPYTRPPYYYGGRRFYCYHPYVYHPYRPFYWGPVYHPWGFFAATLAATAIIVSVNNQAYHYDQGVYYMAGNGGYTVVQAPVGATITTLPTNSQTVVVNETTNNYYYGGTYYEKSEKGYTVVPPTAGTIVSSLPEGGEEVKLGEVTYVKLGETYYQPIQQNGKDVYEVVNVEDEKK